MYSASAVSTNGGSVYDADGRALPVGWVKQWDDRYGRFFFIDQCQTPPRTTWEDPRGNPSLYHDPVQAGVHDDRALLAEADGAAAVVHEPSMASSDLTRRRRPSASVGSFAALSPLEPPARATGLAGRKGRVPVDEPARLGNGGSPGGFATPKYSMGVPPPQVASTTGEPSSSSSMLMVGLGGLAVGAVLGGLWRDEAMRT